MRHTILACGILALTLLFCILFSCAVLNVCESTLENLTSALQQAEAGNPAAAQNAAAAAHEQWETHEQLLDVVLRHDETDGILKRFAALKQYAELEDEDEFQAVCAELLAEVRHVKGMVFPTLGNIL